MIVDIAFVIEIVNLFALLLISTATIISQRRLSKLEVRLNKEKTISDAQYRLKYEACLAALDFVDQSFLISAKSVVDAKYAEHDEEPLKVLGFAEYSQNARKHFNQLVLACEDPDVVDLFRKIVFPQKGEWISADLKIDFQRAIRRELGFTGEILYQDRARAFLATAYPEQFTFNNQQDDG